MTSSATNVAAIQSSGQDPIDAAFDAAIAELERLDANGHTTADLIEAREQYRQERSAGIDAAAREQELRERLRDTLEPGFPQLSAYILAGDTRGGDPYREVIQYTAPLAEVLSVADTKSDELTDAAVPCAAHLLWALLSVGQNVGRQESDREIARIRAQS